MWHRPIKIRARNSHHTTQTNLSEHRTHATWHKPTNSTPLSYQASPPITDSRLAAVLEDKSHRRRTATPTELSSGSNGSLPDLPNGSPATPITNAGDLLSFLVLTSGLRYIAKSCLLLVPPPQNWDYLIEIFTICFKFQSESTDDLVRSQLNTRPPLPRLVLTPIIIKKDC